jgi:putative oxidoreductase
MANTRSPWWAPTPHDALRSVELVRVVVAVVLLSHPLHLVVRPDDAADLARALAGHGVPQAAAVAWLGIAVTLVAGLALLARRAVAPAAAAALVVVALGTAVINGGNWWVVGGSAEDGAPGIEFGLIVVACLAGVWWTWRAADRAAGAQVGLQICALVGAFAELPHGASAFVRWDVDGMRGWGEAMSALGFPFGVALVWAIKGTELVASAARLARRLVVPACLAHLAILVPGMWISHRLRWFVVGPGEGGVEYSVMLATCAVASALASWPRRAPAADRRPAAAAVAG